MILIKKMKSLLKFIMRNTRKNYQKKYLLDKYDFIKNVSFVDKKNFNFNQNRRYTNNLVINWIIPNIGLGGGGHLNIFRFIDFFQKQGHINRIYIIGDNIAKVDSGILEFINKHYLDMNGVECFRGSINLKHSDITFSTSWDSAYYLYYDDNTNLKAYFIQDYEPYFFSVSSDYVFSEMTYEFGFYHLCASKWLANKVIKNNFGSYFDLGVDLMRYKIDKTIRRKSNQVFVYLRSTTPRRATEIVLLALIELKKLNNEIEIVFAGEEKIDIDIPFKYQNLGILHPNDLPIIYNQSTIALVGSLTNYSLLPQELMASGCLVVDIDLENNRIVHEKDTIVLAGPSPFDIAEKVNFYLTHEKERKFIVNNALEYVTKLDWNNIMKNVEHNILKEFKID
jgi:hypothetical protein